MRPSLSLTYLATNTHSGLRADLLTETKSRTEAESALAAERAAREELAAELLKVRYAHSLAQQQYAAAQTWAAQAASYYGEQHRQGDDERARLQAQLDAEREESRRLQAQLVEAHAERQRVQEMLEIETLGRRRVEELLDAATRTRDAEARALQEVCEEKAVLQRKVAQLEAKLAQVEARAVEVACAAKTVVEGKVAPLQAKVKQLEARLDVESHRYAGVEAAFKLEQKQCMRYASLLKQIKHEREAPFVVPAIMDVFALIANITDDVLEQASS